MPLESTTTIAGLDDSYPLGGDPTNKGDDHLRLVKSVLKLILPGAAGNGFAIPIVATEVELNYLTGLTSNAQAQFDAIGVTLTSLTGALSAPVGTRMAFHQAAAPTGWTQDTSKNDYMLRVVSGTGGSFGGTDSPILNNTVPTHSHTTTVTDPGHFHGTRFDNTAGIDNDYYGSGSRHKGVNNGFNTGSAVTGISVAVADNTGADWTPKYLDIIIAVKD